MSSLKASDAKSVSQQQRGTTAVAAAPQPVALGQRLGNQALGQLLRSRLLQAKLTVSNPDDVYEQEADRVADQVMRMADPQQQPLGNSAVNVQRKFQSGDDELRRSQESAAAPTVDAATEQSISSLSGRGSPLPQSVRAFMEPRFNADFSAVRVHTDAHAHALARAVNAQAFTIGRNVVFGAGRYTPETDSGKRLLAHELTHVVQQTTSGNSPAAGTVQRQDDGDADRVRVDYIYETAWDWSLKLGKAQTAHQSLRRVQWIKLMERVLGRIEEIERNPEKIDEVDTELQKHIDHIETSVAKARAEWQALERRYNDQHDWLQKQESDDATLAAKQLKEWYTEAKRGLDRGAIAYITDEDFATLKDGLARNRHVAIGVLKASRERARRLKELLDVVAELRIEGEEVEKYVPGWYAHVQTEADHLELLLATAPHATYGYDSRREFTRLRSALLSKRDATLKTQKRERPLALIPIDVATGVADGLVGGFVEAAKQAYDLTQIGVHFASLRRYEPEFISGTAAAAERGATSRQLLVGMAIDPLLAPQRLLEAVDKGDWEAIGREGVGVFQLAQTIRRTPGHIKRAPELLAKTQRAVRILRARVLGALINQPRLLPFAPLPLVVTATRPPLSAPVSQSALMSNRTTPSDGVPEHIDGSAPGDRTMAGAGPRSHPPSPPGRRPPRTPPPPTHQRLLDRLAKGVDPSLPAPAVHVASPPPAGTFRRHIHDGDVAYDAYNDALAVSNGREVALYQNPQTGEYAVTIGHKTGVGAPLGPENWHAVVHYHPDGNVTLTFRMPSPADFVGLMFRHAASRTHVREFIEFDIPGVGRGRTEYGIDPAHRAKPLYVRIYKPNELPRTVRFENEKEYRAHWSERTVYVEPKSPLHRAMMDNADAVARHNARWGPPSTMQPKRPSDRTMVGDPGDGGGGSRSRRFGPNAVLDDAVADSRRANSALLDKQGVARPAGVPDHLDPETMRGTCGYGSQQVAESLARAGVPSEHIYVNQVSEISGIAGLKHQFIVYERPGGVDVLVDTTFAQFTGTRNPHIEALLTNGAGAQLRRDLLGKGYTLLTDDVANLYLRVVSPELVVPAVRATDFKRASANLARNPTLLPSDGVPEPINSDRPLRLPPPLEPLSDGVPLPIDDAPSTRRVENRLAQVSERIGEYLVSGTRRVEGDILHRHIWSLDRIGGPTTDIGPFTRFVELLRTEAAAAGAKSLKITGHLVGNPNIMRLSRLVKLLHGTVRQIDQRSIEFVIPVNRR